MESSETKSKGLEEDKFAMDPDKNFAMESENKENEEMEIDVNEGGDNAKGTSFSLPEVKTPLHTENKWGEPRLMITQIVNENFKSYAGRQVLGPFHKNFTSIVGPNGSGKSNVIDSMLFVFGYRANKIRSKKVSVLIHNSSKHQNVESCSVHVHFQKIIDKSDDEFEVVANSRFVVSRTAYRDNSSSYYLDGKKKPFKEVATFLRAAGIDLDHNRFLILQGEVEQIAMMKPKAPTEHEEGMLEYLEDIVGSSTLKQPIEELATLVEELSELRTQKLGRVKAVEKEKDELEGAKDEAIEYQTMLNDITKKKNILFQHYIYECEGNVKKAEDEKAKYDKEVEEIMTEINQAQELIKAKVKENKKVSKVFDKAADDVEKKRAAFQEFERQDVKCREDMKHAKTKRSKLEKSLEKESKKLEDLRAAPETCAKQIESLEKKLGELEKRKEVEEGKLGQIMASLKDETKGLQSDKDVKELELLEVQKYVDEAKSKMDVAQSELDLCRRGQESVAAQLAQAKTNLETAKGDLADRKGSIVQLEKRIPEIEKELKRDRKELDKVTTQETNTSEELLGLRSRVEEGRSSLQASKSRGRLLQALVAEREAGRIPGILGRLGDLGTIEERYDVAVSTACGPLDYVLVDSMATARTCVQFLKRNELGMATFMGLDKMEVWKEHTTKKISTPEKVPRLFDLIKVKDARVLPAFYFAVRDTLVARDLDQATRIAYQPGKRHRVVTLQGQLIEMSGTMSGGGNKVARGRMSSSLPSETSPQELEQLTRQLEQQQQAAALYGQQRAALQENLGKLERELSQAQHNLDKYTMDFKALTEQEGVLKTQITELEEQLAKVTPDKKHLKQLEDTLAKFKKDYEKVAGKASKVESKVKELHEKIMEIGGSKMKGQQSRVDEVNSQIDKASSDITKANVTIKTAQRNTKKAEDKIKSLRAEQAENQERLKGLEKEFTGIEEDAGAVLTQFEESQAKLTRIKEMASEIQGEIVKLQERDAEVQKQLLKVNIDLEKYTGSIKDNKQKIRHWTKELSKLKLDPVDLLEDERPEELVTLGQEELAALDPDNVQYQITVAEEHVARMQVNCGAIAEYRQKEKLYLQRVGELDQISEQRDGQRRAHDQLRKKRLDTFMAGFTAITLKLKEMYQMITLGGDAELELVDSLDPFSEGIVFSVRPPKKSWKNISNLSGGEKTLSSLALVFALHHYKPTPLYVMDEIDAALDFKNVSIVANYIKERTKNAQFIIISLRNNMFELADYLVGIYKTYDCTKSVVINPNKIGQKSPPPSHSDTAAPLTLTTAATPVTADEN